MEEIGNYVIPIIWKKCQILGSGIWEILEGMENYGRKGRIWKKWDVIADLEIFRCPPTLKMITSAVHPHSHPHYSHINVFSLEQ